MLNFRHILPVLPNKIFVFDQFIPEFLLDMRSLDAQPGDALDRFDRQVEAIKFVQHHHVKGRCGCAFFDEASNVDVVMIGATIGQAMDKIGISMIGKDNRFVASE